MRTITMTTSNTRPIEIRPIGWLKPYGKNTKNHPDEQIKRLARTIKRFGWDQPIVVEADGTIIKGHGRRLAALEIGLTEVPVLIRDDLTKDEADAARIADNAAFGMSYDTALMQEELSRLMAAEPDFDLDDLALTDKEKTLLSEKLDEAIGDALMIDTESEIERQKEQDQEGVAQVEGTEVALSKAIGFSKVSKAEERLLMNIMAEAEDATGKTGREAFFGWCQKILEGV
jgi:ParB-like chromosome segregation protein Spo0J